MGLIIIHEQTDIADNDIQDLVLYCQQAYYIQCTLWWRLVNKEGLTVNAS